MDDYPPMDELWEQSAKDSLHSGASRKWVETEVYGAIRDLRIEHGAYIDVQVLVPWCDGCIHFESKALESAVPASDILAPGWRMDYRALGVSRREIAVSHRVSEKNGEGRRPSRRAAHELRTGDQYEDREGAGLDDPTVAAAAGGSGDSIAIK